MKAFLRSAPYVLGLPLLACALYFLVPAKQYLQTVCAAFFTYATLTYLLKDLHFRHKNGELL
ncbi:hypothetical protein HK27_11685 [Acetobacter orientalis]|uniref:Alpha-2-macroglobulin n=1 Tax=Acetobacter orientalis TaxID=146474 RepID=A0A252C8Z8_9PROT|nr:hypothetical protein [Acetobacter orientalis]MDN6041866.1 hypothetical protein [Acetobacter sp.]MCP1220880.1 hypothetical protein [Acetobacter orientalis]OUI79660.1 hypothetical protein HK12_12755 [Acetobacter orientalis]OUJ17627.1 hypothetical protein HK27_11685 [Acetobacter orientalis]BBC79402.1 alpha-2-macroglobulin [Acetobacter orientalis]